MTVTVVSKNGIPIRLTDERWAHIVEEHSELAGMRLEVLETTAQPLRSLRVAPVSCSPLENWNLANFWSLYIANLSPTASLLPPF